MFSWFFWLPAYVHHIHTKGQILYEVTFKLHRVLGSWVFHWCILHSCWVSKKSWNICLMPIWCTNFGIFSYSFVTNEVLRIWFIQIFLRLKNMPAKLNLTWIDFSWPCLKYSSLFKRTDKLKWCCFEITSQVSSYPPACKLENVTSISHHRYQTQLGSLRSLGHSKQPIYQLIIYNKISREIVGVWKLICSLYKTFGPIVTTSNHCFNGVIVQEVVQSIHIMTVSP